MNNELIKAAVCQSRLDRSPPSPHVGVRETLLPQADPENRESCFYETKTLEGSSGSEQKSRIIIRSRF